MKCFLVIGLMILAGCSSKVARWENAGTLIIMKPAEETTRYPSRLGSALGETELGQTRVETTEGIYIVHGKIGVAQPGFAVKIGYSSTDENQNTPIYLAFGSQQYEIAQ